MMVDDLNALIDEYDTVAIADLHKVRAIQLQQISKKFRNTIRMKVAKKSLLIRALQKNSKSGIEKLTKQLEGTSLLLLSDMNPFELTILFEKNKTKLKAKSGDLAPDDIIIPAGNTGVPPGPMISELHSVGIRTKIDVGSVWVIADTVIVKEGEVIQPNVASVLSKLGVEPLEVGLVIRAAYDKGSIFTYDQLRPRIIEIKKQLEDAVSQAFSLSINSVYPTPETCNILLQRVYLNARNLAINSHYVTQDVVQDIIARAYRHMMGLVIKLAALNEETVPLALR
jgi:large subunit ribosomal protein L10